MGMLSLLTLLEGSSFGDGLPIAKKSHKMCPGGARSACMRIPGGGGDRRYEL